jgi:superfamily II DNA or RNA helicase
MSNIALLRAIFTTRTDVFAIRWQKGAQSGYAPAYQYDPYLWRQHKMGGGTSQNFAAKSLLPLTDEQFQKHLDGQHFIGIYPLLTDNTSWWIAADFDEHDWAESAGRFLDICQQYGISAYLERSRSGNGGHVWVFFSQPYPALKSRKLFTKLLEISGAFSVFDKSASFDRLFPNQDYLSGKGFGNLIALPLHGPAVREGNCCFIDPKTLTPFSDQWAFLQTIQRTDVLRLEAVFDKVVQASESAFQEASLTGKLVIKLDNAVHLLQNQLNVPLANYLKDTFTIANSAYYVKQKAGKSTWDTDRFFKLIEEDRAEIRVPRGGIGGIFRFCRAQGIDFEFRDDRKLFPPIPFDFSATLLPHQELAVQATRQKDFGVIVAPPGAGKTIVALKIAAEKQQPTLILVHRKQLLDQWVERIEAFLGIPKREIGVIGQGKVKIGEKITIGTIQSLPKLAGELGPKPSFGLIVVDECHHVPATTFRDTIGQLHTRYLYGLTATPFRKHSDGRLIFLYLGDIIFEIKPEEIITHRRAKILVRPTPLEVPFNPKTDAFEVLSKILIHDSTRNQLILRDIEKELKAGRKVVVITERKEHIDALYLYLKQRFEVITLSGDDTDHTRHQKWQTLQAGNYQALITTGQFFGEGTDLTTANCLFLVYPFSFKGKLIQYIGRVQRGELQPVIYDYHDQKIAYLHRMFLKRNTYYRSIYRQQSLFDEPESEQALPDTTGSVRIREKIKVPIGALEFQYGSVAFWWPLTVLKDPVWLEIENDYMRPEFSVLVPFLEKTLDSKWIMVDISIDIEDGLLMANSATSPAVDRINREMIEAVRFQFSEKYLFAQKPVRANQQGLLQVEQVQGGDLKTQNLYPTGEELLADVLTKKTYRHTPHLRYLAEQHLANVLKLRFVLSPFSFVFLLKGNRYYYIILETLDTEEATYIWRSDQDKEHLKRTLDRIDADLQYIRTHGRHRFLSTEPSDFTRIQHDYSDAAKGFLVWRAALEGCLG